MSSSRRLRRRTSGASAGAAAVASAAAATRIGAQRTALTPREQRRHARAARMRQREQLQQQQQPQRRRHTKGAARVRGTDVDSEQQELEEQQQHQQEQEQEEMDEQEPVVLGKMPPALLRTGSLTVEDRENSVQDGGEAEEGTVEFSGALGFRSPAVQKYKRLMQSESEQENAVNQVSTPGALRVRTPRKQQERPPPFAMWQDTTAVPTENNTSGGGHPQQHQHQQQQPPQLRAQEQELEQGGLTKQSGVQHGTGETAQAAPGVRFARDTKPGSPSTLATTHDRTETDRFSGADDLASGGPVAIHESTSRLSDAEVQQRRRRTSSFGRLSSVSIHSNMSSSSGHTSSSSSSSSSSGSATSTAIALGDSTGRLSSLTEARESEAKAAATAEAAKQRPWALDDFTLGKPLGKGRFGNVYNARERLSKAPVALKVLFKGSVLAGNALGLLRREVEIHTRLCHSSIIRLCGYFHDQKCVYLILERAEGGELYKSIQLAGGRYTEPKAQTLVGQVASALAYMHARHVMHRDLKPENVLLGKDGEAKLADFGWAVHAPPPATTRHTVCGTPEYLPPEMIAGLPHDKSVDMWSLGIFSYELLFGYTPFSNRARQIAQQNAGEEEQDADESDEIPPSASSSTATSPMQQVWDRIAAFNDECLEYPAVAPVRQDKRRRSGAARRSSSLIPPSSLGAEERVQPASAACQAFIASLLRKRPEDRMCAADARRHEWLVGGSSTQGGPLAPVTAEDATVFADASEHVAAAWVAEAEVGAHAEVGGEEAEQEEDSVLVPT